MGRMKWVIPRFLPRVVLLGVVALGLVAFLMYFLSTRINHERSLDEIVVDLVNARDSETLIGMLQSGELPVDYKYRGEGKLIVIAAYAKLPDLFNLLLNYNRDEFDSLLASVVFTKDDQFAQESIAIMRYYIASKSTGGSVHLGIHDSIYLLIAMCTRNSLTLDQIKRVFSGIDVNVESEAYAAAVDLAADDAISSDKKICIDSVVTRTSP